MEDLLGYDRCSRSNGAVMEGAENRPDLELAEAWMGFLSNGMTWATGSGHWMLSVKMDLPMIAEGCCLIPWPRTDGVGCGARMRTKIDQICWWEKGRCCRLTVVRPMPDPWKPSTCHGLDGLQVVDVDEVLRILEEVGATVLLPGSDLPIRARRRWVPWMARGEDGAPDFGASVVYRSLYTCSV
ncbi:hypothetical protein ACLOJK_037074 [Asimina triloba]